MARRNMPSSICSGVAYHRHGEAAMTDAEPSWHMVSYLIGSLKRVVRWHCTKHAEHAHEIAHAYTPTPESRVFYEARRLKAWRHQVLLPARRA